MLFVCSTGLPQAQRNGSWLVSCGVAFEAQGRNVLYRILSSCLLYRYAVASDLEGIFICLRPLKHARCLNRKLIRWYYTVYILSRVWIPVASPGLEVETKVVLDRVDHLQPWRIVILTDLLQRHNLYLQPRHMYVCMYDIYLLRIISGLSRLADWMGMERVLTSSGPYLCAIRLEWRIDWKEDNLAGWASNSRGNMGLYNKVARIGARVATSRAGVGLLSAWRRSITQKDSHAYRYIYIERYIYSSQGPQDETFSMFPICYIRLTHSSALDQAGERGKSGR